ncbi:ATP-binding protein [Streptacidiphilus sp. P02-A3a]|uniref:ATP-binding protein n=1 Tax=Streptacidiphilus sp. P02-A3a TaxID=2704468 RepID=UPI0015F78F0F|nr:ATP-binding protein [Streptacidiphilus sp. P02-A3a]QMU69312.1 ATP-binding protein [Streptacidiphilus sp. P02-A3a]
MSEVSIKAMGWAQSFPVRGGVRAGRRWALRHLDQLGWCAQAPDTVDDVLLAVSELITNAHVHARSDAQVVLIWDRTCLQVSVSDSSPDLPTRRHPDREHESGRGMAIVEAVSDTWEAHSKGNGKTISACFHPPGQPSPHDQSRSTSISVRRA